MKQITMWRKWEQMKSDSVAKNSLVVYCYLNDSPILKDCENDYYKHAQKMKAYAKRHNIMCLYNLFFSIPE